MDAVMWDALKQVEFPDIRYKLVSMVAKGDAPAGGPVEFDTQGTLTVAGVTRTNSMVVTMVPMEGDKLKFSGNTAVKMTDFGIKPPAPEIALGLIKTGDEVKIGFEWLTALKTGAAP
jgi:polyisoprenoid-binding protein YceI